jgi:NAD(P)H-hydrate epimerase
MHIVGVGVDLVYIKRIDNILKRKGKFLNRVFTEDEVKYFNSRGNNSNHVAGNFAAKEAVVKSLGTGFSKMGWKDIEVLRDDHGKPYVNLYGNAYSVASTQNIKNIHISITHDGEYAAAYAVAEAVNSYFQTENVPESIGYDANIIEKKNIKGLFPKRKNNRDINKGTFGTTFIVAGSLDMPGAAIMCGLSSLRSGAGIVKMGVPNCIKESIAPTLMESIVYGLPDCDGKISLNSLDAIMNNIEKSKSFAIGPGISISSDLSKLIKQIIQNAEMPGVIDADAINIISKDIDMLKNLKTTMILTPHPGEMARLIKKDVSYVQQNRIDVCRDFSQKYGVVTLLKGANTVISSPDGEVYINTTGNSGMSKGGSGDVLTGMIASFLAWGMKPLCAAYAAAYIHGLAGDMAAFKLGEYGMKAQDIIDNIPYAIKEVSDEEF